MKHLSRLLAVFLLAHSAFAEDVAVRVRETIALTVSGATAAYALNPTIIEVITAVAGTITVTGLGAGTTHVVVVTPIGTQSIAITVLALSAPPNFTRGENGQPAARYEGRYSGNAGQVHNSLDIFTSAEARRSHFHILEVHHLRDEQGRSRDAIASVFYRLTTPARELTLLDEFVDLSPITIRNTQLRGLHLRQGSLELHAGYAASTMYDDLFLPADRRWAAGAGYAIGDGSTRWIPSVYGFFSEPSGTTARRGIVGALAAEHRRGDTFFARGEVGVSRSLAAAGEIQYRVPRNELRAFFSLKANDFPTLGLAEVPGTHAEVDWTRRATDRLTIVSYGTFDRFNLPAFRQRTSAANVGLRYALTPRISLLGGGDASFVRSGDVSVRTVGVPLGVAYDSPSFGASTAYRVIDSSLTEQRGDSVRLSARTTLRGFHVNAWVQRQRQAPTLELIFSADPALELALLRLGISVRSPEDVARALRDNAALIDLGFITGVNIRLTPQRDQGGFDLGWTSGSASRDQLRFHAVYDRDEGIATSRAGLLSTLSYSRRVAAATDVFGAYSWWRSDLGERRLEGTSLDVGLRQQFSGLPRFLRRSGTVEGVVFVDPEMDGVRGDTSTPLADVAITLDGTQTARTEANGTYAFRDVPPGPHRIAAQLPDPARAFFTTPSHAEVDGSARVDFGVVWAAARVVGRVVSDAGVGIINAVIAAVGPNGTPATATTGLDGDFALVLPPGTFRIALAADSLPAGYTIEGQNERTLALEADRPQTISFAVTAVRSVAGRAVGAAEVRIERLGRTAKVDGEGNFVFRSMPAGNFTITARRAGRVVAQTVTLSAEPMMLRGVVLGESASSAPKEKPPQVASTPRLASTQNEGSFRVRAGAFRIASNAAATKHRIERLGHPAQITNSGSWSVLTVGPFDSRIAADTAAEILQRAGIEGIVEEHRREADTTEMSVRRAVVSPRGALPRVGSYLIQVGAFREEQNSRQLIDRLRRRGQQAFSTAIRGLMVVYLGPFASRGAANTSLTRLRQAGFDGYVTKR